MFFPGVAPVMNATFIALFSDCFSTNGSVFPTSGSYGFDGLRLLNNRHEPRKILEALQSAGKKKTSSKFDIFLLFLALDDVKKGRHHVLRSGRLLSCRLLLSQVSGVSLPKVCPQFPNGH